MYLPRMVKDDTLHLEVACWDLLIYGAWISERMLCPSRSFHQQKFGSDIHLWTFSWGKKTSCRGDEEAFICNANSIWVPGQPGFLGRWGLGARKLALSMIILQTLAGQPWRGRYMFDMTKLTENISPINKQIDVSFPWFYGPVSHVTDSIHLITLFKFCLWLRLIRETAYVNFNLSIPKVNTTRYGRYAAAKYWNTDATSWHSFLGRLKRLFEKDSRQTDFHVEYTLIIYYCIAFSSGFFF